MCSPSPSNDCLPKQSRRILSPWLAKHIEPHPDGGSDWCRAVELATVDADLSEVAHENDVRPAVDGLGLEAKTCVCQRKGRSGERRVGKEGRPRWSP